MPLSSFNQAHQIKTDSNCSTRLLEKRIHHLKKIHQLIDFIYHPKDANIGLR